MFRAYGSVQSGGYCVLRTCMGGNARESNYPMLLVSTMSPP